MACAFMVGISMEVVDPCKGTHQCVVGMPFMEGWRHTENDVHGELSFALIGKTNFVVGCDRSAPTRISPLEVPSSRAAAQPPWASRSDRVRPPPRPS
eukprot:scaffold128533_cov37-Tisochrysis_lutea.AAC.3